MLIKKPISFNFFFDLKNQRHQVAKKKKIRIVKPPHLRFYSTMRKMILTHIIFSSMHIKYVRNQQSGFINIHFINNNIKYAICLQIYVA